MVARSSLRYLAPIALVVVFIALIVVVASSGGGGSKSSRPARRPAAAQSQPGSQPARTTARTYVVKPGDSLLAIAEKTGVPTDQLQRLNPDIDPQVLVPGQRLRLRP
jgi:teichoic acid transport system ATP-binding protein